VKQIGRMAACAVLHVSTNTNSSKITPSSSLLNCSQNMSLCPLAMDIISINTLNKWLNGESWVKAYSV